MTARKCFVRKIAAGKVPRISGRKIIDMLNEFEEAHKATLGDDGVALAAAHKEVAEIAASEAARKADQTRGSIIAQSSVLRAAAAYDGEVVRLRDTPGDLGFGNKAPPTLGKDQSTLGFSMRARCWRATRSRYLAGTMCITSRATSVALLMQHLPTP